MTAAQLHTASVATTVLATSVTVPITATTAGSTLILMFAIGDNDEAITSVTSAGTPTWTKVDNDPTNGSITYWGTGIATGTVSVVVNLAGSDRHNVVEVNEWSGLATFEGAATVKTTTTGTTWTSNSYTTTNATDVVIGWVSGFPTGFSGTTTVTPTGAWTLNATTQITGDNFLRSGYQVVAATASFTFSGTTSQSAETLMHVLAFTQTGGTNVDVTAHASPARAVSSNAVVSTTSNVDVSAGAAVMRAISSAATVETGSIVNILVTAHAAIARMMSSAASVTAGSFTPPVWVLASIAQRTLAETDPDFQNWANVDRNTRWTDPENN